MVPFKALLAVLRQGVLVHAAGDVVAAVGGAAEGALQCRQVASRQAGADGNHYTYQHQGLLEVPGIGAGSGQHVA
jgi:hypothetical protein